MMPIMINPSIKSSTWKTFSPARNCVECVFMAAAGLMREEADPIQAVANIASQEINEAIALLKEYRGSGDAGPVSASPDAKPKSPSKRTKRKGK
jgi:hypothetical protein